MGAIPFNRVLAQLRARMQAINHRYVPGAFRRPSFPGHSPSEAPRRLFHQHRLFIGIQREFRPELVPLQTSAMGIDRRRLSQVPKAPLSVGIPRRPLAEENSRSPPPIGGKVKRAMDIVISLLAIVLLSPIMLMVAALIRLTMGGPVMFAQRRVGFDGSAFLCYKFRTMVTNADEVLKHHLAADPKAAEEWLETRKLRNDPRISCIGRALRKSSLDELPQLFNVLRGDMSIVGPRPVVPPEISRYGLHANDYVKARPGLTGLWQVSGRNSLSYARRVALDAQYVRTWSIWLDIWILIRTVPAVLSVQNTA